jgi:ribonuclease HI
METQGSGTVVFCDGAAKGNPGPGGWGVVIATTDGQVIEMGGQSARTTNNKMELTAAIEALRAVAAMPGPVAMHTDST